MKCLFCKKTEAGPRVDRLLCCCGGCYHKQHRCSLEELPYSSSCAKCPHGEVPKRLKGQILYGGSNSFLRAYRRVKRWILLGV